MRWNLALAGLAASWGLIAVLAGAVSIGAGPLAFFRLAIAALTLALVAALTGRVLALRPGSHLRGLIVLGCVQATHWWLFFEAVQRGSVALAVLTFATAPVFLAVLAPAFLPERRSKIALGALVPSGVGLVLVVAGGSGGIGFTWQAIAAGLGSALTFAVLLIVSKRLLDARAAPLTVAFWDCLFGAVVIAPALLFSGRALPVDTADWGALLVLGIVFTGLSTFVYAALLRRVTAQSAGVLTFFEPVAAVILAWALLDESVSFATASGGALVLAAGLAVVVLEPAEPRLSEAVGGIGSMEP